MLFIGGEILALEFHYDEALFSGLHLLHQLVDLDDPFFSLQFLQELVFANQDLFGFIGLFHFEGDVTAALVVTCMIYNT